jgi:MFS family permease
MKKTRTFSAIAIFATFICLEITLVCGLVSGPTFRRIFELTDTQLGLLLGMPNIGLLFMALVIGHFTERTGPRPVQILGLILMLCGLSLVLLANTYRSLLLAFATVGISAGMITNSSATLLAELFPSNTRRVMSLAAGLWFGSSALSAPIIGAWLKFFTEGQFVGRPYHGPYFFLLAFTLLCVVSALRISRHIYRQTEASPPDELYGNEPDGVSFTFRLKHLWIPALALCHGFMILSITSWINPMLQSKFGVSELRGSMGVAALAVGIGSGRLFLVARPPRIGNRALLSISSTLGGIFITGALFLPCYVPSIVALFFAGLVASCAFPCIMASVSSQFHRQKGRIYGYMYASVAAAGLSAPFFIGVMADHGVAIWRAMIISPLAALVLGTLSLVWKDIDK